LHARPLAVRHASTARDDVNERGQNRQEHEADHPQHFRSAPELGVAEKIHHKLEQYDEVGHQDESRDDQNDRVKNIAKK
jgi:hypothetical protein